MAVRCIEETLLNKPPSVVIPRNPTLEHGTDIPEGTDEEGGDMRKKGYAVLAGVYRDVGRVSLHIICGEHYFPVDANNAYMEGEIFDLRLSARYPFARVNRGMVFISRLEGFFYFFGIYNYHCDHFQNKAWLEILGDVAKEIGEPEDRQELIDLVLAFTQSDQKADEIEKMIGNHDLFSSDKFFYLSDMRASIPPPIAQIDWESAENLARRCMGGYGDLEWVKKPGSEASEETTELDIICTLCKPFLSYTRPPAPYRYIPRASIPAKLRRFELLADHFAETREI